MSCADKKKTCFICIVFAISIRFCESIMYNTNAKVFPFSFFYFLLLPTINVTEKGRGKKEKGKKKRKKKEEKKKKKKKESTVFWDSPPEPTPIRSFITACVSFASTRHARIKRVSCSKATPISFRITQTEQIPMTPKKKK